MESEKWKHMELGKTQHKHYFGIFLLALFRLKGIGKVTWYQPPKHKACCVHLLRPTRVLSEKSLSALKNPD